MQIQSNFAKQEVLSYHSSGLYMYVQCVLRTMPYLKLVALFLVYKLREKRHIGSYHNMSMYNQHIYTYTPVSYTYTGSYFYNR